MDGLDMATKRRLQPSEDIGPIEIIGRPFCPGRWDFPLSENALLAAVSSGIFLGMIVSFLLH